MEGHDTTNECYSTLEEAKEMCLAAPDCYAIATQSNTCGGQFRVSHGGPTFNYYSNWEKYNLRAWELSCSTGNETSVHKLLIDFIIEFDAKWKMFMTFK